MRNTDFSTLSPKQLAAIRALAKGATVSAAAAAAGVHRSTIHDWSRNDIRFRAAIVESRHQHAQQITDRIRDLSDSALDTVAAILAAPKAAPATRLRAALAIIRSAGTAQRWNTVQPFEYHDAVDRACAESEPESSTAAAA